MSDWPEGYGRVVVEEIGSTLDEAVRLTADTAAPFWLLARRQTAARGRRGRSWHMGDGNFAATLVLRLAEPPGRAALRTFVMSLALLRAISEVTGRCDGLALKWPNDVLLNGGKVAGILLEGGGSDGFLAVGVGVNLITAPERDKVEAEALTPVSLTETTGIRVSPEAFLDVLAGQYADLEQQFVNLGFAPVRAAWLAHAARLGEVVTARTMTAAETGVFEDVDAEGHLVLRGPRGRRTIAAAEVFF